TLNKSFHANFSHPEAASVAWPASTSENMQRKSLMDSTMETVDDGYNAEDDTHPAALIESTTQKHNHNTRGKNQGRKYGKTYTLPQ
ncbi:MAG: hypothetical protein GY874_05195, partial [Desulfobacteraceae bacterium]|nr:hypothetical protein [Desulfobacteraceae bacterium]